MTEGVPLRDIPQYLLDDIGGDLEHYVAAILGLAAEGRSDPLRLIGSGTFVVIGGRHYVLTAAHVWEMTERFPTNGLILTSTHHSWFPIPRDTIAARVVRGGPASGELGPDLALLELPPNHVPRIAAHKSFLDLAKRREEFLGDPLPADLGIWAVTGISQVLSKVRSDPERHLHQADVQGRSFFAGVVGSLDRDDWDYLDTGVNTALAGVPPTFGGVSGAGLWQIPVTLSRATGQMSWTRKRFNGVAFWQSPIKENRRVIRCHGPRGLFVKAWSEWRLPEGEPSDP